MRQSTERLFIRLAVNLFHPLFPSTLTHVSQLVRASAAGWNPPYMDCWRSAQVPNLALLTLPLSTHRRGPVFCSPKRPKLQPPRRFMIAASLWPTESVSPVELAALSLGLVNIDTSTGRPPLRFANCQYNGSDINSLPICHPPVLGEWGSSYPHMRVYPRRSSTDIKVPFFIAAEETSRSFAVLI